MCLKGASFSVPAVMGTRAVWIGVGSMVLLQLAFTYLPAMQRLVRHTGVDADRVARHFRRRRMLDADLGTEKAVHAPRGVGVARIRATCRDKIFGVRSHPKAAPI